MEYAKREYVKIREFLRDGYYEVRENGQFVQAAPKARQIFQIPENEKNLSKYSIAEFYTSNEDRKRRIERLREANQEPVSDILSLRINNENTLLYSLCWCQQEPNAEDELLISGFVSKIGDNIIFPRMFEYFPMGVYELDENNRIVRINKKTMEIFGVESPQELIGKTLADLALEKDRLKDFNEKVSQSQYAQALLQLKNDKRRFVEIECVTHQFSQFPKTRWGFIHQIKKEERFFRDIDNLPTGYYYIEYEPDQAYRHQGVIKECNKKFAEIWGYKDKEELLGTDIRKSYASKEEGEAYLKKLDEMDESGQPVLGHNFRIKQKCGETRHISIDAHLVREEELIVGREGTIRDITDEIKLRKKIEETEKDFKKATTDINNLIHTFLHPVIKFSGNAELFHQVGDVLYQTIQPENYVPVDDEAKENPHEFGRALLGKLIEIKDSLPESAPDAAAIQNEDMQVLLARTNLKNRFSTIIRALEFRLENEGSDILLTSAVRDSALWVLQELQKAHYHDSMELRTQIPKEFIEMLQGILFQYITKGARVLVSETEIMKREVDALRKYIGMKKDRKYAYIRYNIGKILEESLELFKPVLKEKGIAIRYSSKGNLNAEISPSDLDRVVSNLLHNVKKYGYGGQDKFVTIEAKECQPEDTVRFSIRSFGIPIDQEEIDSERIYEFGYRGERAYASDRDGTGVGLADAKDVVKAHDGEIHITSKPAYQNNINPRTEIPYITEVTIEIPKKRKTTVGGQDGKL